PAPRSSARSEAWAFARSRLALAMEARRMKVRELMQRSVTTVGESDTLALASQLMLWNGIRHLPVMRDGRVVGMLSERDVLAHASPDHPLKRPTLVGEAMSAPVKIAPPHMDTSEAAAIMVGERIDAL